MIMKAGVPAEKISQSSYHTNLIRTYNINPSQEINGYYNYYYQVPKRLKKRVIRIMQFDNLPSGSS